mgnify:CR=1 FL=1
MTTKYYVEFTQYGIRFERYYYATSESVIRDYLADCIIHHIIIAE